MKIIPDDTIKITVELNKEELTWLRDATQNEIAPGEPEHKTAIRLSFYVMASRALGYKMNDDGSVSR